MFTADAARIIGITPKQLRSFLRGRNTGVGSGARYEFSHEEVDELKEMYWANQAEAVPVKTRSEFDSWLGDGGTKGLSTSWLTDPAKQALFVAERQARLERLGQRLREAGLDVPQMTDKVLKVNNRAIARAVLFKEEFA